jgi:hypothetical protein
MRTGGELLDNRGDVLKEQEKPMQKTKLNWAFDIKILP